MTETAVIYVPPVRKWRYWQEKCIEHCQQRGYEVVSMAVGENADWGQVQALLKAGKVDVLVVGRVDTIRLGPVRVEVVDG